MSLSPNNLASLEKILVIGPSWLGDMVMAQSLFKHLKQVKPQSSIDVAAPSWSFPLLERMPEIQDKIKIPFKHRELALLARVKFGQQLAHRNYSSAIVLPNSWKSAIIPWAAKIPKRTGWYRELRFGLINDLRFLNSQQYSKMVDRYVALAYPNSYKLPKRILYPKLQINRENIIQLRQKFNLHNKINLKLPVIALAIGAKFGDAKCWPEQYFINLANKLAVTNKFNVFIFGTVPDLAIDPRINNIVNFSGKTSILETVDLLSLSDTVVCNDSGLMHIAASLNKVIIAIYGATTERFTPPLTDRFIIVNKHLACSPCFARNCPLKHHNCMKDIKVEEIFQLINNYSYENFNY